MSNPPHSLSAKIDGFQLFEVLGHPTRPSALPCSAVCPICRLGTLKLFEDHARGGQWFHCCDCRRHGDMVELAAAVWQLSARSTILKLKSLGYDLPEDVSAFRQYAASHLAPRRRARALWALSRQRWKKPDFGLNQLTSKLRLRSDVSLQRRPTGPGGLFGGVHRSDVERCFAPGAMRHADRRNRQSNPSAHAVFRGAGWDEVLAVPYFDLPGRISAYMFVGRDADPDKDVVFKPINRGFRGNQYSAATVEAGLSMHPRTLEAADRLNRTVVAYHNPLVTLPLQVRYFAQSLLPLPLVAWHDSLHERSGNALGSRVRTHHGWQLLGNRRLVFWMPRFRLATLRQAIEQDGLISTAGPLGTSAEAFQEYLWRQDPGSLFGHLIKTARPWRRALAERLEELTDEQLESLYHQLRAEGLDAEHVFAQCGQPARRRIGGLTREGGRRVAQLGRQTIIERGGCWYLRRSKAGSEELICDALLRVDKILNREAGEPVLVGRVVHRGVEHAFAEPQLVVHKRGMDWLREVLIRRGASPPRIDSTWSRRLIELAELFHRPEVAPAIERMGWDADRVKYVFPHFSINSAGEVEPLDEVVPSERLPGMALERPIVLSPEELSRPGDGLEGILFWAVAAAVIANIIAPQLREPTMGLALVGGGAQRLGSELAIALGCLSMEAAGVGDVRSCLAQERQHGWPLVVTEKRPLSIAARGLLLASDANQPRNIIAAVNRREGCSLALSGRWHMVASEAPATASEGLRDLASLLLPAYLQDAFQRRMPFTGRRSLFDEVLQDLAYYSGRCYGPAEQVLAARQVLVPAGCAATLADAFMDA